MSLNLTNINYSGKAVNELLTQSFSETLFHKNFGARILPGFKCKYNYFQVIGGGTLETYSSCPTTFGDITLNQRSGSMCEIQYLKEMDKNALACTAREIFTAVGFNAESVTDDTLFTEAVLEVILSEVSTQWDNVILNGDVAGGSPPLDVCDGLLFKWNADPDVIDVTIVPANITPSAVIGELNKVYNAVPSSLKFNSNPLRTVKFGVSINIADAYAQYLTQQGNGFNFFDPTKPGVMKYLGYEIVPLAFLPNDTAFATYPYNIALFVDGEEDFSEIRTWDLSESRPCDKIQMRVKYRSAVDYGFGTEIVLGQP
jgi:hypothetical protein